MRVRLEADSDVTTMRYVSPVGAISPRRASTPATPSADSRPTNRESAARLRVAEVQAYLRESRRHLDAGELQLALAAVTQALKLDVRIRRHVRCSPRWMRLGSMQSPNIAEARDGVERGRPPLLRNCWTVSMPWILGTRMRPLSPATCAWFEPIRSARNDSRRKRCTYPTGLTSQRHRDRRDRPVQRQGIGRCYRVNSEQRSRAQRR